MVVKCLKPSRVYVTEFYLKVLISVNIFCWLRDLKMFEPPFSLFPFIYFGFKNTTSQKLK